MIYLETLMYVDKILPVFLPWRWAIWVENRWIRIHQKSVVTLYLIKEVLSVLQKKSKQNHHKSIHDTDIPLHASDTFLQIP